jgi:hypothetical protein
MTTAYAAKSLFTPRSPMQMQIIPERIKFSGITVSAETAPGDKRFEWPTERKALVTVRLGVMSGSIIADRNFVDTQVERPTDDGVARFVIGVRP